MLILAVARQAGLKIIELYMEGYRQDWKLSFEKDTVSRGGWYVNLSYKKSYTIPLSDYPYHS